MNGLNVDRESDYEVQASVTVLRIRISALCLTMDSALSFLHQTRKNQWSIREFLKSEADSNSKLSRAQAGDGDSISIWVLYSAVPLAILPFLCSLWKIHNFTRKSKKLLWLFACLRLSVAPAFYRYSTQKIDNWPSSRNVRQKATSLVR